MEFFGLPGVGGFTGVLLAVAAVGALEVLLVILAGAGLTHFTDTLMDTDALPAAPAVDWLIIREVPLMLSVLIGLSAFGVIGLAIQAGFWFTTATTVSGLAVGLVSALGTVSTLRASGKAVRRLKVVHTTALSSEDFIGRHALLLSAAASQDLPGEAKFIDEHGQLHYVMVHPVSPAESFKQGDVVVLREKTGGFHAATLHGDV